LTASQLFKTLKDVGMADDNILAELERDARRTGKSVEQLFEEEHIPALKAVSKLLAQSKTQTVDQEDYKVNKNYGASAAGGTRSYQTLDNQFNLPMLPSQNKVEVNNSYDELDKKINKLVYDDKGQIIPYQSKLEESKTSVFGDLNTFKEMISPSTSEEILTSLIPPNYYKTMKEKGMSDRDIANSYGSHAKKMHKLVNTDYTFLNKADEAQALNAIISATSGGEYVDENGEPITKVENLEKGSIKFNPTLGSFYIVKDDKQYHPKIELPTVKRALEQSKELVDDFTNLNSKTNIVNMGDRLFTIIKDEIRPDGTYAGRIGEVQEVSGTDGNKKYKQISTPTPYDTKQGGDDLLPTPVKAVILNLLKKSTQELGVTGVK
jgi:hypothetical protein